MFTKVLRSKALLRAISYLGVANFVIYLVVTQLIGGDAVNGYAKDGHYFLQNHARLTEVSQLVFTYSLWHTYSLFITTPLAMLAGALWQVFWPRK